MAKMQNQLKQLLAENKKLNKHNGKSSDMEIDEGEDGDNVAASSSVAQRTELQAKISKYEQTIKMYKDDGEDELVRDLQKKLEETKLQVQSLRTPVMAPTQCTQKLQRVQKQISTAKHDVQSLQQKVQQVQKEQEEKKVHRGTDSHDAACRARGQAQWRG
jgi:thiamine kinase-like enzyme